MLRSDFHFKQLLGEADCPVLRLIINSTSMLRLRRNRFIYRNASISLIENRVEYSSRDLKYNTFWIMSNNT